MNTIHRSISKSIPQVNTSQHVSKKQSKEISYRSLQLVASALMLFYYQLPAFPTEFNLKKLIYTNNGLKSPLKII